MKYISTSDIHLGHTRTPTEHIISSFKTSILTDKNKDIDILFIAGDLFDRLLDLSSKEALSIVSFFNHLLTYCVANNIMLRVLEGTPSHDWKQSELLTKLNEIRIEKCNLKYFKVLDIEYIQELNKYVLYIPDEWVNEHTDLEKQINAKLLEYNINQVDIAILHGQFEYQMQGKKFHGFCFQENYFLNLVKGYIHIGHFHIPTTHDRILGNGSLERLAHGEEDPKGYILVEDNNYVFIENTNSYIYKTINITPSITLEKLDRMINKYPKSSHIRLLLNKDHPFNLIYPEIKLRYMDYNLKKLIKEHISESSSITYILNDTELEVSDSFVLDNDIHKLLSNIVENKYQLNSSETSKFLNYISIFKEVNHDGVTVI